MNLQHEDRFYRNLGILMSLRITERVEIDNCVWLRVPGGFVYHYYYGESGVALCFIPLQELETTTIEGDTTVNIGDLI
jgi:hypothetical protein